MKREKNHIRGRVRQLDSSAHDDSADSTEIKEALRRESERSSEGDARVGEPTRRSSAGQVKRRQFRSKNRRSKPREPEEQLPADEPHHSSSRGPQAWSQSEDKPRNGHSRSLSRSLDSRTHSTSDASSSDRAFDAKTLNEEFFPDGSFLSGSGRDSCTHSTSDTSFFDRSFDIKTLNEEFSQEGSFLSGSGRDSCTHSTSDTSFFDRSFDAKTLNEEFSQDGSFLSGSGRRQTRSLRRLRASSQASGLQCPDTPGSREKQSTHLSPDNVMAQIENSPSWKMKPDDAPLTPCRRMLGDAPLTPSCRTRIPVEAVGIHKGSPRRMLALPLGDEDAPNSIGGKQMARIEKSPFSRKIKLGYASLTPSRHMLGDAPLTPSRSILIPTEAVGIHMESPRRIPLDLPLGDESSQKNVTARLSATLGIRPKCTKAPKASLMTSEERREQATERRRGVNRSVTEEVNFFKRVAGER
jgi:hypothetical protein